MRAKIAALVVMGFLLGPLTAHAAESSTDSGAGVPARSQAPFISPGLRGSESHLSHVGPGFIEETTAQDCEGKAPSTGPVTALLSRLISSSSGVQGVQCPIPSVPDQSTGQETGP